MAMRGTRAKQIARALRGDGDFPEEYKGSRTVEELNALFNSCFRIQREASAAAGRHIPMVVENVRGACPWVRKSRWNFGSFHLWGDVPALMPIVQREKKGRSNFHFFEQTGLPSPSFPGAAHESSVRRYQAIKNSGGYWFAVAHNTISGHSKNPVLAAQKTISHVKRRDGHSHTRHLTNQRKHDAVRDGLKHGADWFSDPDSPSRQGGMTSTARKAASAQIAKIPIRLSRWIAAYYKPAEERTA